MQQTDRLGRATFNWIAPRLDITLTERDFRWMKHIERHGPLSSTQLFTWTAETHRCKDSSLRRLQALRASRLLNLPLQQRQCARAEFKPYVYDLSAEGHLYLKAQGIAETTLRPTGHWWHIFETACFTAKVDAAARRNGFRYIPGHEILERGGAKLTLQIDRQRLIPDQLFAIDYGGQFRAFMVEVDRGTEPIASATTRKSWRSAIALYARAFENAFVNRAYGLKAPVQVIWRLHSGTRREVFLNVLNAKPAELQRRFIVMDAQNHDLDRILRAQPC